MSLDVGVGLWSLQATVAAPDSHARLYEQLVEDALEVEALGYDSLWFAEHHFWYDGWCPTPLLPIAAVAAATNSLRLGTGMSLLPLHPPARLLRTARTVDELAGGRLELGVGLGHRDAEFDGFGIERRLRGRRMDSGLDTLLADWPRGPASIWVGGMAPPAIRRGATRGTSFLLPQTLSHRQIAEAVTSIRAAAEEAGVAPGRIGLLRDGWLTDDAAEAARVRRLLEAHYREEIGSWWVVEGVHGHAAPDALERQVERSTRFAMVGDAATQTGELEQLEELGVDAVVVRFRFDVTRDDARATMRAFARHVLPEVRS